MAESKKTHLRKLIRFGAIYGPRRALIKALGRLRIGFGLKLPWGKSHAALGLIGCGQFAFSTLAYFARARGRFVASYDKREAAARSFARMYGGVALNEAAPVFTDPAIETVYIASNHASHEAYASRALQAGKTVYVEKPVAVSREQLARLCSTVRSTGGRIHAGYNRPFSGAIRDLRARLDRPQGPLTLSCFVSGHVLEPTHWYRDPAEGTRVCGNVGHWLDLAVHLLSWRSLPDSWRISLAWSDEQARDENVAISLASEAGDLVSIVLTARTEPFEGINESINLQWDSWIAKIDDFRRMTVWRGETLEKLRYWPKDVGHRLAVLQPFDSHGRDWREVELSSLLMLRIAEMVTGGVRETRFSFSEEWAGLKVP